MLAYIFALGCSVAPSFAATIQGSFSVLSYNVAGLPEPLSSSSPATNTPLISPRLGPFDVVHVQEDFNYHSALYASDHHTYRTTTSGPALFGSGLNTLSNFPYTNLQRIKWNDCDNNSGDCLTPKGFTFMRVRVAEGVWIDFYNLHTDAGSETGDINARSSNIAQVIAFANKWSANMPVIIYGDTNTRYNRDSPALHNLLDSLRVEDLWIQIIRNGVYPLPGSASIACPFPFPASTNQSEMNSCEVLDRIFIRSNSAITLRSSVIINENNQFLDSSGFPLSDHYPISSVVDWQLSSSLRLADPVGGAHDDPFNDLSLLSGDDLPRITSITLRSGSRLNGVSLTLRYPNGTDTITTHGGQGGTSSTLALNSVEYITQLRICSGSFLFSTSVFYSSVTTNQGRILSAGSLTNDCQTADVPSDSGAGGKAWGLLGFWGRAGNEIEQLGAIWGAVY